MKKITSTEEYRKLLLDLLQKYERVFCANVAMSLVLKKHDLLTDDIPKEIRTTVRAKLAPLFAAIEAQDEDKVREFLLNMPSGVTQIRPMRVT